PPVLRISCPVLCMTSQPLASRRTAAGCRPRSAQTAEADQPAPAVSGDAHCAAFLISTLSELPSAEREHRFWPDTIRDISGDVYKPAGAVDRLCPSGARQPPLRTRMQQTLRIPRPSTS